MVTSEHIKTEILERFGFLPPFFEPAQETPEVLANLWQQTLSAYIDNPLPALFKEKLFAYLSRYCSVPYCIVCHSCALRPLGMTAGEVLQLLQKPVSEIADDIERQITILQSQPQPLTAWPEPNSTLERSLYGAAILIFLRPYHAEHCRTVLSQVLGKVYYTHLISFLGYVKTCHHWIESHPEISLDADRRAQLYLASLLEETPELAEFFQNYDEKITQEKTNWKNQLTKRIIDLQRVEKALQESEKKCQLLVNNAKDAIFQTDVKGKWTFLNPAWGKITGFSTEESIGKHFTDYVHPDDRQGSLEEFQALIERRKELSNQEVRYLTKEGGLRWVEVGNQVDYAADSIIGTSGTIRDISDRKAAEIALQQSNSILRAVIEGTADAVFVKDIQGRYILANSTVAHIFQRPVEEILGRDDSELGSRETALQLMETDRKIMSSGQSEVLEEITTINNITRTYLSTKDVYRDSQGNIIGLIGIARDISDRKQLELEREQLIEQLRIEREDLAALSTVTANAISTLKLDELLDVLLRRIVKVLRANTAVFLLKEGDRLRVRATIGIDEELSSGFAVPIGQGFAGTVAASCQPLYIEDAQADPHVMSQIIKQTNIRTMLGVPLKRNGTLIGVLHVDWSEIHRFNDREVHLLEITAERCAMAIVNAQLFEETKQLKDQLQLQFDRMPIGCMLYDRNCRLIDWNPAAERIFGFTKQEVLGKHPCDLVVPSSLRPRVDEMLRLLSAGNLVANSINENITKDGRTIICEWDNTSLKKADGSVIGILSMVQDITDRKLAEDALRDSEKRYRSLFQSNPHPMWVFDVETLAFLDVNEAAVQHYGYSPEEFLAMTIRDIRPPEDIPALLKNVAEDNSWGYHAAGVWRHRKKDGTIIYVEIASHTITFLDRRAEVVLVNDITDRKLAEDALRESEERFRQMAENVNEVFWMSDVELTKILYISPAYERIWGRSCESLYQQPTSFIDPIHPEDRERVLDIILRQRQYGFILEYRIIRPDGSVRWVLDRAFPVHDSTGKPYRIAGISEDITRRKQAEEELRKSIKKLSDFKFALDKAAIVATTNATGTITYINDRFCEISQYSKKELLGQTHRIVNSGYHPKEFFQHLWSTIASGKIWQGEIKNKAKDGSYYWVDTTIVPFLNEQREPYQYLAIRFDITDRKQAEEQLRRYAFYDPLTGLPNRTLLLEQIRETIELHKRGEVGFFATLLLDLDRFQMVKFSLGHQVADRLLIATASRLQACLINFNFSILNPQFNGNSVSYEQARPRIEDSELKTKKAMLAQVGLDEFAIVLTNLQEVGDATRIADQICQELALPFNLEGQEVFITASIGITLSSIDYDRPEDYLRAADTAMHQSKKLRKTGYAVFESKWQTNAVERLHLEADLRRAIDRQELRVFYQPIVSLANNRITGFEALVRWQHPTRGLVPPGDFIPLAEETGLIISIDRWVLREACRQIVVWQQTFPSDELLMISANLSAIQLAQSDLIVQVEQILQETRIDPKSLKLEITESSLQENTSAEKAILEQLKGLGVELAIDDFGTGYSSLARLHQMPIDKLKIDRSFINLMGVDSESLEFVSTIVRLAHILDLDVIAEGVETSEQLAQLKDLQCEYGQGYFFSRPVDSEAAKALLAATNKDRESKSLME